MQTQAIPLGGPVNSRQGITPQTASGISTLCVVDVAKPAVNQTESLFNRVIGENIMLLPEARHSIGWFNSGDDMAIIDRKSTV